MSIIGTWMQRVGQDWLVLQLTHNAEALSTAIVLQFLPVLLFGLWGGVVIDRFDTRRLLMVTQALQALLAVLLAVVSATHVHPLAGVYVLATLLGLVTVVDNPARQVFVVEIVDRSDLVNAITLNSAVNNIGRLVGPALAGITLAQLGVTYTFLGNAVSFLAVLVGLAAMRVGELHERPPAPDESVSALDGLRYVMREPALRAIMIVVCFVSVFGQNFRVVLPVLAATSLHGDAQTYAWLTAMLGLGALIGGFLTAGLEYPTRRGLMISCTTFAAANVMVAIAPVTVVALAGMVVMGIGNIAVNTISRSLLQLVGDPAMGSRVMAVYSMVFLGSNPIGAPISGLLCTVGGARTALVAAGALSLLPTVALVPRLRLPPQKGIPALAIEDLE